MRPFYEDELVTLYCADSRDMLSEMADVLICESVITDPVWPNAPKMVPGHDEHEALMREVSTCLIGRARRLVVHLGSTSDPRWLVNIDSRWPFLCAQHLEFAMPSYRGRALVNDIAYAFGDYPDKTDVPRKVQPGRITCSRPRDIQRDEHPAPRSYEHVAGLVSWWAGKGPVLDPFAGSGTTLLAAKNAGLRSVGIEREERFCELIVSRLRQSRMVFEDV